MIISVSRRTDIPAFYSDWFYNRIEEGYVLVKNPFNAHQVSMIILREKEVDRDIVMKIIQSIKKKYADSPLINCFGNVLENLQDGFSVELPECFVFWTKDPSKMLPRIQELSSYKFYFQFTLTPYKQDFEPHLPDKITIQESFKKLSSLIGREKVIWRYDPIIIIDPYSVKWHLSKFQEFAQVLVPYTQKCVISFVDIYEKVLRNMRAFPISEIQEKERNEIAEGFSKIAHTNGLTIETCAEFTDLSKFGILKGKCIDDKLISKLVGQDIMTSKDKNQREECGCVESIDIGLYNTCLHGCNYCYANFNKGLVLSNHNLYDPHLPMLCSNLSPEDKITLKKSNSNLKKKKTVKLKKQSSFF